MSMFRFRVPAKAGNQFRSFNWAPAFAGERVIRG